MKFIELMDSRYTKNKFKVSVGINKEYFSGEGVVTLINYLNSSVRQKTYQPRVRAIYTKIIAITVFFFSKFSTPIFSATFTVSCKNGR